MGAPREPRRWMQMFGAPPPEHGFTSLELEGAVPEALRLTAYFNGPGHFATAGRPHGHWFDGDGSVAAVRLRGGAAEGAYKTITTRHRIIEAALRRPIFGGYGTHSAWPLRFVHPSKRIKTSANTSILCHGGEVFALMEGTKPVRLDPDELDGLGTTNFGVREMANYSAHPVRCPDGRLISTGIRISREDHVDVFETRDGSTRRIAEVALPFPTFVHSFAVIGRKAVLILPPLRLDKLRFLFSLGTFSSNLRWEPERGTEVVVVDLDDPTDVRRFTIAPFFFWHVAQAFEEKDRLCVDLVRYDDAENAFWLAAIPSGGKPPIPGGRMHRLSIDPVAGTATLARRADALVEFPVINPACRGQRASTVFCGSDGSGAMSGPMDQLLAVDVDEGSAVRIEVDGDETYPSEPLAVPRSSRSGDAWLLSLVYDASRHRSYLAVIDGLTPGAGPVAKAWFPHHVPARFHGDTAPL